MPSRETLELIKEYINHGMYGSEQLKEDIIAMQQGKTDVIRPVILPEKTRHAGLTKPVLPESTQYTLMKIPEPTATKTFLNRIPALKREIEYQLSPLEVRSMVSHSNLRYLTYNGDYNYNINSLVFNTRSTTRLDKHRVDDIEFILKPLETDMTYETNLDHGNAEKEKDYNLSPLDHSLSVSNVTLEKATSDTTIEFSLSELDVNSFKNTTIITQSQGYDHTIDYKLSQLETGDLLQNTNFDDIDIKSEFAYSLSDINITQNLEKVQGVIDLEVLPVKIPKIRYKKLVRAPLELELPVFENQVFKEIEVEKPLILNLIDYQKAIDAIGYTDVDALVLKSIPNLENARKFFVYVTDFNEKMARQSKDYQGFNTLAEYLDVLIEDFREATLADDKTVQNVYDRVTERLDDDADLKEADVKFNGFEDLYDNIMRTKELRDEIYEKHQHEGYEALLESYLEAYKITNNTDKRNTSLGTAGAGRTNNPTLLDTRKDDYEKAKSLHLTASKIKTYVLAKEIGQITEEQFEDQIEEAVNSMTANIKNIILERR